MRRYRSPITRLPLRPDTPHSLATDEGERWPVIDGIVYLRADCQDLAQRVLVSLDAGDRLGALVALLAQNDRWWTEPPPDRSDLMTLIEQRDTLSLRGAMKLLAFGRVGTYFAHRWSDPTFMAGVALIDAHWNRPATAFELACGIGHYLRALKAAGVTASGADIVFAKLWVARHWVVGPDVELVCFDADELWPVTGPFDLVLCQDAFYFFEDKVGVAAKLLAIVEGGSLVMGHVHNTAWPQLTHASGATAAELANLFPGCVLYDDAALTRACANATVPQQTSELADVEAFGLVHGWKGTLRLANGPVSRPRNGVHLKRNPLCVDGAIVWPSERYEQEYRPRATYTCASDLPHTATMSSQWEAAVARRDLLDLPERW